MRTKVDFHAQGQLCNQTQEPFPLTPYLPVRSSGTDGPLRPIHIALLTSWNMSSLDQDHWLAATCYP
jgi:hypothetical protein